MAIPHSSDPELPEPDLAELPACAAKDPSFQRFVEETKRAVADGSIWDQVAEQPDLGQLLKEYGYCATQSIGRFSFNTLSGGF